MNLKLLPFTALAEDQAVYSIKMAVINNSFMNN